MIPVLLRTIKSNDNTVFETTDWRTGLGFHLPLCDIESSDPEEYYSKIVHLLRTLSPSVLARIHVFARHSSQIESESSRGKDLSELGSTSMHAYLIFEEQGEPLLIQKLKTKLKIQKNQGSGNILNLCTQVSSLGLDLKPLSEDETTSLFVNPNLHWEKAPTTIQSGTECIGIIRLKKPTSSFVSTETIANLLKSIPKPFEICVSFKKIEPAKRKLFLEKRLKQTNENPGNPTDAAIADSTTHIITESLKRGSELIEYEYLIKLKRNSESEVSVATREALLELEKLGETQVETFGVAPSWLSTLPGNSQHVTLRELDDIFPLLLPVWRNGESRRPDIKKGSLLLHREDRSISCFDLFDSKFNVFNTLIIGTSGKGKSVLTGLLTRAILNDPNTTVIKIDVGGSHSKECELLGGREYLFDLNSPCGINPFQLLRLEVSEPQIIAILSKFLGVLIREQREIYFSKSLTAEIEENVREYINKAKEPSLQEFYDLQTQFPRRDLLRRWVRGGIYQSSFSGSALQPPLPSRPSPEGSSPPLRYYNFSKMFQASDPEFAQAGIAAVLAQFNIETLTSNKRIILICDETPFFIKSCFDFFKFTTANVRKFGHAVVLISQLSTDLIVNDDTGIIENSPQRFLFSIDGSSEVFKNRFNLTDLNIETIKSLRSIPKEYSQVLLQSPSYTKKLQIEITPKEYLTLSTSKQDQEKIKSVRSVLPNLTLKEVIECLSI